MAGRFVVGSAWVALHADPADLKEDIRTKVKQAATGAGPAKVKAEVDPAGLRDNVRKTTDEASKTAKIKPSVDHSESMAQGNKWGTSFGKSLGGAFTGVVAALGVTQLFSKATSFISDSLAEARESQKVMAETTQVIKTTGAAAGFTAEDIGKMSGKLSNLIGVDDELIQHNANLLLTFTNIRGEIFQRALPAAQDMAKVFGGDSSKAAIQLGKALNDPVKGIGALAKVGVSFSADQKKVIKSLVDTGDTAGAQKIILDELAKEFGGQAAAQVSAADKARVAWGNLKEYVGTKLLPVVDFLAKFVSNTLIPGVEMFLDVLGGDTGTAKLKGFWGWLQSIRTSAINTFVWIRENVIPVLINMGQWIGGHVVPALKTFAEWIQKAIGWMVNNKETVATFVGTLLVFKTVVLAIAAATKVWAAIQLVLNGALLANPVGLIVIAIAALVAGVIYAYKHFDSFRIIVQATWGWLRDVAGPFIKQWAQDIGVIIGWLYAHVFKPAFDAIRIVISALVNWIRDVAAPFVKQWVQDMATTIGWLYAHIFKPTFDGIRAVIEGTWNWIRDVAWPFISDRFAELGRIVRIAWGVLTDAFKGIRSSIENTWNWIRDVAWPFIEGSFNNFKANVQLVLDKVTTVFRGIRGAIEGTWNWIRDVAWPFIDSRLSAVKAAFQFVQDKVAGVFRGVRTSIESTWNWIRDVASPFIEGRLNALKAAFQLVQDKVAAVFSAVRVSIDSVWNWIRDVAWPFINSKLTELKNLFQTVQDKVAAVFSGIRSSIDSVWNWIRDVAWPFITERIAALKTLFQGLWTAVSGVFNNIRGKIDATWNWVRDTAVPFIQDKVKIIKDTFQGVKTTVFEVFNAVSTKVSQVMKAIQTSFSTARVQIGLIWNKVKETVKEPIKWIIDKVYNGAIVGVWNWFAGKIPGAPKLSTFGFKWAQGGPVNGPGTGTSDSIPVHTPWGGIGHVSNGEHIWTKQEVDNVGGHGNVMRLRAAARQNRWALGGAVDIGAGGKMYGRDWTDPFQTLGKSAIATAKNTIGAVKDKGKELVAGALSEVIDQAIKPIKGLTAKLPGRNVSGSMNDLGGRGIDLLIDKMAGFLHKKDSEFALLSGGGSLGSGGRGVEKIIALAAKSGLPYSVGSTDRNTPDYHGQGKAVDFVGYNQDKLASYFMGFSGALLEEIHHSVASGKFYSVKHGKAGYQGYNSLYASGDDSMGHRNHLHIAMNGDADPSGKGHLGTGGAAGSVAMSAARRAILVGAALAAGVPMSWIGGPGALGMYTLIERESGWNANDVNTYDSNAAQGYDMMSKGLAQVIGPTFRTYHAKGTSSDIFNPIANVAAAFNYIQARYGSIANVQQANPALPPRGYDSGGYLMPGWTMAFNGTGKPERIRTAEQEASLSSGGGNIYVTVNVDKLQDIEDIKSFLTKVARVKQAGVRVSP